MKILIVGGYGQVGCELIRALQKRLKPEQLITSDIIPPPKNLNVQYHEELDILNRQKLHNLIDQYEITDVYCLSALLSARGQINPLKTQRINMKSLFNCLQAARLKKVKKIFWPSSIAAFGPNTPKITPQYTIMQPTSVYGITKKSGEMWCEYYNKKFQVDVRSIRYPGLVGYRSLPGGGTTDYAVDIFHKAVLNEPYQCYLSPKTPLPMVYTDDAINATINLMQTPSQQLPYFISYNIQSMTFTPEQIANEIKKIKPNFKIHYKPDNIRQPLADSWPHRLVDEDARLNWNWKPQYDLPAMTKVILQNLTPQLIEELNKKQQN